MSMSLMVHINYLSCTSKSLSLLDGGYAKSFGLSFLTGLLMQEILTMIHVHLGRYRLAVIA